MLTPALPLFEIKSSLDKTVVFHRNPGAIYFLKTESMVVMIVWKSIQDYSNHCGTIDLTKSEKDRGGFLSTLCSMDNLFVPPLSAT